MSTEAVPRQNNHINDLPPEILAQIFTHHIAERPSRGLCIYWNAPREDSEATTESHRLVLESVCHHWTNVVRSTPRLWCTLDTEPLKELELGLLRSQLDTWISRSGILPMSIDFHQTWTDSLTDDELGNLTALILRYADRWVHLRLSFVPEFINLVTDNTSITFPQLRTLFLEYAQSADLQIPPSNFPELRSLGLSTQNIPDDPDAICWEQLTTIELEHFYVSEVLDILTYAKSLVHLRVHLLIPGGPSRAGIPQITQPFLETLDIQGRDEGFSELEDLFEEAVVMPRLKRFRCITNSVGIDTNLLLAEEDEENPLAMFFNRAGCPPQCAIVVVVYPKISTHEAPYYARLRTAIPSLETVNGGDDEEECPPLWAPDEDSDSQPSVCRHCYSGYYKATSDESKVACTLCSRSHQ